MYSSNLQRQKKPHSPPLGTGRTQNKQKQSNPVFSKKKKNGGAPKVPKKQQNPGFQGGRRKPRLAGHLMSPHSKIAIPTALRSGEAFPYTGLIRTNLTLQPTTYCLFAITNCGSSGTVMAALFFDGITAAITRQVFTVPTLALADDVGGPTSGRAMKIGLSLVNTTPLLNRGGRVFQLNANQRLKLARAPSAFLQADYFALADSIQAFPDTIEYDASEFGKTREFTGSVVDYANYEAFQEWEGTNTIDEFYAHFTVWPGSSPDTRPMSTIFIVFSPPAVAQTYTLSAKSAHYTRWPIDTIPGQSQLPIPTAPIATINRIHSIAEEVAIAGFHGLEDVAMAAGVAALVG